MADILLVEPDQVAADAMAAALRHAGHEVRLAESVSTAQAAMDYQEPDAILTELVLPDADGLVFVSGLGRSHPKAALIVMSRRHKRAEPVLALRLGADGFLSKPIEDDELVTRIDAVLRRVMMPSKTAARSDMLKIDDLLIDRRRVRVTLAGRPIHLTPIEYRLLLALAIRVNTLVLRDTLLQEVWGYTDVDGRNLAHLHISRIRQKFGPQSWPRLVAIHGKGHMLETAAFQLKEVF